MNLLQAYISTFFLQFPLGASEVPSRDSTSLLDRVIAFAWRMNVFGGGSAPQP